MVADANTQALSPARASSPQQGWRRYLKLDKVAIHGLLLFGSIWMVIPFLWMVSASVKQDDELFTYPPTILPSSIRIETWVEAWTLVPFSRWFFNSGVMAVTITAGQLITCSMAAYAFARLRFPGRDVIFMSFLATMMVPGQVLLIPQFILMRWFGWIDTYQALILPSIGSAYGVFLLRQFFLQIPFEIEDAARIDGCSRFKIMYQIILPLSIPAMTTLGIFTFMGAWNAFLWPLIVTNSDLMRTVQIGLTTFRGAYSTDWARMMAATCFVTLPVLIAFIIGQRQFIQGITLTGLKG